MLELKHPYISVDYGGTRSYGGRQQSDGSRSMQKCGCGIVAAADVLLYLSRSSVENGKDSPALSPIRQADYEAFCRRLRTAYMPIIPHAGINGLGLMAGMELFFRRNALPYSAQWRFYNGDMWKKMSEMLEADMPVIMSVGPNFPCFWKNSRATLYEQAADGSFRSAALTKAHYVTATGMNDDWVRISSWGRMLYINRAEFERYTHEHSAGFLCSILYISHK